MVKSDNNDTRVILSGWRRRMETDDKFRAGRYILQPQGYRAFIPANLPPIPPISMDDEMWTLLSQADRALGRLDGSTMVLPNPDLFVYMYVRKEAVLSSQIEGTQASLIDLVEFESKAAESGIQGDVEEVVNYVAAMNYGLNRLKELPLSLRLIRAVSYTHLRAHETRHDLVCRLLLEKK